MSLFSRKYVRDLLSHSFHFSLLNCCLFGCLGSFDQSLLLSLNVYNCGLATFKTWRSFEIFLRWLTFYFIVISLLAKLRIVDPTVRLAWRVTTTSFCFFQWLISCCFFIFKNLLFLIPHNCFSWKSIGPALINSFLLESRLFLLGSITILRSCHILTHLYVLISCVFLSSNILNYILVFIFFDILIIMFFSLNSLNSKSIVIICSTIILIGRNLLKLRFLQNLDSWLVRVLELFIACFVFFFSRSTRVNLKLIFLLFLEFSCLIIYFVKIFILSFIALKNLMSRLT